MTRYEGNQVNSHPHGCKQNESQHHVDDGLLRRTIMRPPTIAPTTVHAELPSLNR